MVWCVLLVAFGAACSCVAQMMFPRRDLRPVILGMLFALFPLGIASLFHSMQDAFLSFSTTVLDVYVLELTTRTLPLFYAGLLGVPLALFAVLASAIRERRARRAGNA